MMESVERLVNSGKGWFVLVILALVIFAIRQGYMKVKTEKVLLGRDCGDSERAILRKQTDFAKKAVDGFVNHIPRVEDYDEFRARYILELCYDEMVDWIINNHIEVKQSYIELKQDIIWNVIQREVVNKKYSSPQFKAECDEYVKHIIEKLYDIRNE